MQDVFAGIGFFPNQIAGVEINGNKAGREGRGDGDMAFIHAIGGDDKKEIAGGHGRTHRQIVRENVQFFHHVVFPYNIHANRARVVFCGEWAVIFPI